MSDITLETTLKTVISEVLGVPAEEIGPGFRTQDHPTWSSLQQLMLVSEVERRFDVTFTNQELPQLTSYDVLRDTIARRRTSA
jgi:acyl carrier protein